MTKENDWVGRLEKMSEKNGQGKEMEKMTGKNGWE